MIRLKKENQQRIVPEGNADIWRRRGFADCDLGMDDGRPSPNPQFSGAIEADGLTVRQLRMLLNECGAVFRSDDRKAALLSKYEAIIKNHQTSKGDGGDENRQGSV